MSNKLKDGYEKVLSYVIYNGPPNTIYGEYEGNLDVEYNLMQAVRLCSNLYKYIINPSENVTISHIEHHGLNHVSQNLNITKNIARAIIKHDHTTFKQYAEIFDDNDVINMVKFNPRILKYVKKQTFEMCCQVMTIMCNRSRSALYTELFCGGVGLWHEDIPADFAECFNPDCLTDDEMIKLYDIMFKYNKNSIRCMIPKYISIEMLDEFLKFNPNFIKEYITKYPDHKLSKEKLETIYKNIIDYSITNICYIDHKYQTPEMIDKVKNDRYGVMYYKYFYNIEETGQQLYLEAFEKDPNNIHCIPKKYITHEMYERAFKHDPQNIRHIPSEFQTAEMCKIAAAKDVKLIEYCEYIDLEMLLYVHKQCIKLPRKNRFDFIRYFNNDKIVKILKVMPDLLRIIPAYRLNDLMIRSALETDGYVLQYVENQTHEYIEIALRSQPNAKKYIKSNIQTQ
jgi:hypothetical protein